MYVYMAPLCISLYLTPYLLLSFFRRRVSSGQGREVVGSEELVRLIMTEQEEGGEEEEEEERTCICNADAGSRVTVLPPLGTNRCLEH